MSDYLKERLAEKYIIDPVTTCWMWQGASSTFGAFTIKIDQKMFTANRLAYRLYVGDPGDKYVIRRCGEDGCINPFHAYLRSSARPRTGEEKRKKRTRSDVDWVETIKNHRLYKSGEWMTTTYMAHDMGAESRRIRDVMTRMHKIGQLERTEIVDNGRRAFKYKRPNNNLITSRLWRTISNEELGIQDATRGWH